MAIERQIIIVSQKSHNTLNFPGKVAFCRAGTDIIFLTLNNSGFGCPAVCYKPQNRLRTLLSTLALHRRGRLNIRFTGHCSAHSAAACPASLKRTIVAGHGFARAETCLRRPRPHDACSIARSNLAALLFAKEHQHRKEEKTKAEGGI